MPELISNSPSKVVILEPRWVEYFRQDISRSPTLTMRIGGREPRSLLVIDTKLGRLQDPGSYTVLLETSLAGARNKNSNNENISYHNKMI